MQGGVALVTGASRGIGRAVAVRLAAAGVAVALVARDEDGLRETQQQCVAAAAGARTLVLPCDITMRALLSDAVQRCVDTFGGLNIVVANAGIYSSSMEMCMAVNAVSAFQLIEMALPHVRREAATKASAFVFLASLASRLTFKGGAAYCASKHAMLGYAGSLFEDVREEGIKVTCIMPGFVNTPMVNNGGAELNTDKMIQPNDIADAVMFVLQSAPTVCPTELVLRPQRTPYVNK